MNLDILKKGKQIVEAASKEAREDVMHPIRATRFSLDGLCSAVRKERAFRHELLLGAIHISAVFYFDLSLAVRLVLIASYVFLLCSELLNSAIESVVDKVSPEWDALAKRAKDCGSAASFVAIVGMIALWFCVFMFS